jgi:hypothetical protein
MSKVIARVESHIQVMCSGKRTSIVVLPNYLAKKLTGNG